MKLWNNENYFCNSIYLGVLFPCIVASCEGVYESLANYPVLIRPEMVLTLNCKAWNDALVPLRKCVRI